MTRKRFIKLMMAEGYSRNTANKMAKNAKHPYGCYKILTMKEYATSSLVYPRRSYKLLFNKEIST